MQKLNCEDILKEAIRLLTIDESLYNICFSKATKLDNSYASTPAGSQEGYVLDYVFNNHRLIVDCQPRSKVDDHMLVRFIKDKQGNDVSEQVLEIVCQSSVKTVEPNELDWLVMVLLMVDYLIEKIENKG